MKLRGASKKVQAQLAEPEPVPAPAADGAPAALQPEVRYAARMVTPLPPLPRAPLEPKRSWLDGPEKKANKGLTEFQRTAFRVFGSLLSKRPLNPKLAESLRQARSGLRAEALESTALMTALMGGTMGAMMAVIMLGLFFPLVGVEMPMPITLVIGLSPVLFAASGYAAVMASPSARAKSRAKDIDNRLPYALNYIAAMASAGVNIDTIFKSLGEQKIYGECAKEAEAIYRDISLFGKDTVTAFKRAIARTPSQRFAELLQGAITTFGSGGDLQNYFASKAQRYMVENRQVQKQYMDTMGLMAETYVTTAVAGPLFLMVMMAIMGLLSGGGPGQLYLVVYLMLPTCNFGFVYGLTAMTPKV